MSSSAEAPQTPSKNAIKYICKKGTFFWRHQDVLHPMAEYSSTPQGVLEYPCPEYPLWVTQWKHMGDNASWRSPQCDSGSAISSLTPPTRSDWLHAVTRFPDANSHSCRMLRTNAPWDTMPDPGLSWLACDSDPARCVNWAARGPDSSGRSACSMACGDDADRVRFFGRRRFLTNFLSRRAH